MSNYHPINLNNQIRFKITESGEKYLEHLTKTDPIYIACGRPYFRECEDGYLETELWHFASVFGPKFYNGGNPPVELDCLLQKQ